MESVRIWCKFLRTQNEDNVPRRTDLGNHLTSSLLDSLCVCVQFARLKSNEKVIKNQLCIVLSLESRSLRSLWCVWWNATTRQRACNKYKASVSPVKWHRVHIRQFKMQYANYSVSGSAQAHAFQQQREEKKTNELLWYSALAIQTLTRAWPTEHVCNYNDNNNLHDDRHCVSSTAITRIHNTAQSPENVRNSSAVSSRVETATFAFLMRAIHTLHHIHRLLLEIFSRHSTRVEHFSSLSKCLWFFCSHLNVELHTER